jgi:phage terminase large subunit-like protein
MRSRTQAATSSQPEPHVEPRDYVAIAEQYAANVSAGRVIACKWVKLACERQIRDRRRTDGLFVWSPEHASAVCRFIETLPHIEGRWPTATITLADWQVFLLCVLFGWRQATDIKRRRFTTLYLEIGRKAAKSTLMAGIALFHLLHEDEPGASVVCGASTGQQARVCFTIMQRMVRKAAWLQKAGLAVFANAIVHEANSGSVRPVNSKASTLDGLNPSCILLDESHCQDFGLHDVLKSAQGSRPNPLLLCPTTAGYSQLSVGFALRTTTTKVLQEIFEADHLLGLIYTLDDGDDWKDERVWPKANPLMPTTPSLDWMRTYCLDAQQTPGLEAEFRVKCCSEWLNSAASWISATNWDRCADPSLQIEQFAGEKCWIGVDLAMRDDLCAVAAVFERDDMLFVFAKGYLPKATIDARWKLVPWYRQWAESGNLVATDGALIDLAVIESDIRAWVKQFSVQAIVFDTFGAFQIAGRLEADGLPALLEQKTARTFTPAARDFEARVAHQRLRHNGNGLLRWCVSNAVVERRVDNTILPKKENASSPNKIDCLDACLFAMSAWLRQPVVVTSTIYDRADFDPASVWV